MEEQPPPRYAFEDYLNQEFVQQALGVTLNYIKINFDVNNEFDRTGDWAYPNYIHDIEFLLNSGVRVALVYGDADYICNWFGGEAVANKLQYNGSDEFAKTGYVPFVVEGIEYGAIREHDNFSFMRLYDSGHFPGLSQPVAILEYFRRVLGNKDVATGEIELTPSYGTFGGEKKSTHTQPFVPLPDPTGLTNGTSS